MHLGFLNVFFFFERIVLNSYRDLYSQIATNAHTKKSRIKCPRIVFVVKKKTIACFLSIRGIINSFLANRNSISNGQIFFERICLKKAHFYDRWLYDHVLFRK